MQRIMRILTETYPDITSPLHYRSPFQLLCALILAAQSTDEQVNRVTTRLFAAYPNADALARARKTDLEELVYSTGFFRAKAAHLREAAAVLRDEFGGEVPSTMEELLKIPGIGRKSANVLLGALFGKPAIIVDTHFARVVYRLECVEAVRPEQIERVCRNVIPADKQYAFSMRINFHGRYVCTARNPGCTECPLAGDCPYPGRRFSSPKK